MISRRMKNLHRPLLVTVIGLLCVSSFGAFAQATGDDLDAVMHLLAARRHGEVSFVEQHFLSLLKKPVESTGELIYDAPNRLEKRTLEPHPETLVLAGDVVTVQRGHSSHVLDLKSYPQVIPLIESVRATLAGDRASLERMFRLEFTGDLTRWTLVLVPRELVGKTVARVQIDGYRDVLLKVEIRQTDGDRSLMTLRPHAEP
jgi:outer membrane lipoprotein-sorting protein